MRGKSLIRAYFQESQVIAFLPSYHKRYEKELLYPRGLVIKTLFNSR